MNPCVESMCPRRRNTGEAGIWPTPASVLLPILAQGNAFVYSSSHLPPLARGMQEARHLLGAMEGFPKSSLGDDFLLALTSADAANISFASTETRNASLQISSAFALGVSRPRAKRLVWQISGRHPSLFCSVSRRRGA